MPKIAEEAEPLQERQEEQEENMEEEEEEEEPLKIGGGLTGGKPSEGPGSRPRRRNESENYPPTAARFGTIRPNFSTPHLRPVPHRRESVDSAIVRSDQELRGSEAKLPRPMSRADIFYTGSIRNLVEEEAEDGLKSNRQSFISLRRRSSIVMPRNSLIPAVKEEEEEGKEEEEQGVLAVLSSMTNLELLGDPKFLLICASNTFGFLGFYVPFVYLPSLASGLPGISSEQVPFIFISLALTLIIIIYKILLGTNSVPKIFTIFKLAMRCNALSAN